MANDLETGFTGTPTEQPEGARKIAKTATDAVKRETSALAAGGADHPQAATGLVFGIGAVAFTITAIHIGDSEMASDLDDYRTEGINENEAAPIPTREDEVRKRVHIIWEREGRPDGRHEDHWNQASARSNGSSANSKETALRAWMP